VLIITTPSLNSGSWEECDDVRTTFASPDDSLSRVLKQLPKSIEVKPGKQTLNFDLK
jgi:hypothetical protein